MKNTKVEALIGVKLIKHVLILVFLTISVAVYASDAVAYSQSKKFSFELKNITLKEFFKYIEKNSEFVFLYYETTLDDSKKVSVNATEQSVEEILNQLLKNNPVDYEINGRQIILKNLPSKLPQQEKGMLQGVIIDSKTQEPIPWATILVKGTNKGVIADEDGLFSISCSTGDILLFSYIGYKPKEIKISKIKLIQVEMEEDLKAIDEIVVTAYGTGQKKASIVGSIQTVRPDDLKVPTINLSNSFAGRLAGVIAVQRSGQPGADGSDFWIRGISTFSGSATPLIILDGVQVSSGDLNHIDPEIIEGFSILKDATATAMYGMRGANGVMIVTTKSGMNLDKPIINFRIEGTISQPTSVPEFVDGATFMELYNEGNFNQPAGKLPYSQERIDGTRNGLNKYVFPNVDWYDELFKDSNFNQNFNFNIRGGGKKVDYFSSISVNHETGMLKSRSRDFFSYDNSINNMRYMFQNNINAYLGKTSKLSLRLNVQLTDKREPRVGSSNLFSAVMNMNPVDNPVFYEPDGMTEHIRWGMPPAGDAGNPVAEMASGYTDTFANTVIASLDFEQKLDFVTKGLRFKAMGSFKNYGNASQTRSAAWNKYTMGEYRQDEAGTYSYDLIRYGNEVSTNLLSSSSNTGDRRVYLQAMIDYNRIFGQHDVNAVLLYNQDEVVNSSPGSAILSALPRRKQGVAARASYAYGGKYLAELNLGYNGSENFAEGNRFGFFPSVAVGYNVSEEKFFEPIKNVISNLKIRGSWGLVGNDEIGSERFIYLANVNLTGSASFTTGMNMNYNLSGPSYARFTNNDIRWEVGEKLDIGMDLQLWNKLNLTFDVFQEKRRDIFQAKGTIPTYLGMDGTTVYGNYSSVTNKGTDFAIDYGHSFNKNFNISVKGTFTYAHNEITSYEEAVGDRSNLSRIGHGTHSIWGYLADGLFADATEIKNNPSQLIGGTIGAGDIKYLNIPNANGIYDNIIDANDRICIGNPSIPEIVYGFGPSIRYKHLDFSFFFQGVAKTSLMMSGIQPFGSTGYNRNVQKYIADNRWSPTSQNVAAAYPRLTTESSANNTSGSTYWLRDGAFLKLKNVEAGYTYRSIRVYVRGSNLLTFSKFKLWDPEQGGGNGLKYPTQRIFNFGFQMTIK